ncbi:MAG TPA: hypothetical protein VMG12_10955 [Polyangiaceae bacterium]|nr:hypothetical protein [Polyangiaceae bacterium]
MERSIQLSSGRAVLDADLRLVDDALGLVVFAHGSGSSRKSVRNLSVARALGAQRLSTALLDLLTADEAEVDAIDSRFRFDIPHLARRLGDATDELLSHPALRHLPFGYFGASTGAAAALMAAADRPDVIGAIVSRGGRPDLASHALAMVRAPTLLIVGGADTAVLRLNQTALDQLQHAELAIVAGATHLFEEPGALDHVGNLAGEWLSRHLANANRRAGGAPSTRRAR